uniref:Uncharacterized protein LOC111112598 n=1 Tax=Crassostrea virginica TaxID=6565 RepID=A0A8B8BRB0_CRAVI|nr:uncharacterized protein LOC111112598 [Crassostrea virginica]
MASSLSRNLQLCPHCNQFLSRRTVLRHRQLYGKPHRPGWRPVLNIPSIQSHRSSRDSLIESENVTEAIREIPEEDQMDVTDSELSGTDSSSDDDSITEDDQGAVHWDEPDEELDRDLLNPGGGNGRSPNKSGSRKQTWTLAFGIP